MASLSLGQDHPYPSAMLPLIRQYLADSGNSGRSLGLVIAGNPFMLEDLAQGDSLTIQQEMDLRVHMDAFYDAATDYHMAELARLA